MISVAAAITIPATNAVKQEKSNRSLRTTLMAASPLRAMVDFAQGTPLPWRKRDLVELWDQILRKVAFADPSNLAFEGGLRHAKATAKPVDHNLRLICALP